MDIINEHQNEHQSIPSDRERMLMRENNPYFKQTNQNQNQNERNKIQLNSEEKEDEEKKSAKPLKDSNAPLICFSEQSNSQKQIQSQNQNVIDIDDPLNLIDNTVPEKKKKQEGGGGGLVEDESTQSKQDKKKESDKSSQPVIYTENKDQKKEGEGEGEDTNSPLQKKSSLNANKLNPIQISKPNIETNKSNELISIDKKTENQGPKLTGQVKNLLHFLNAEQIEDLVHQFNEELKDPHKCLNNIFEETIGTILKQNPVYCKKNPNFVEIRYYMSKGKEIKVCEWCVDNCKPKNFNINYKTKVDWSKLSTSSCQCGKNDHHLFDKQNQYTEEVKNKINQLKQIYNESNVQRKADLINEEKEQIMSDEKNILERFYILSQSVPLEDIAAIIKYNDELYYEIFSHFKSNKDFLLKAKVFYEYYMMYLNDLFMEEKNSIYSYAPIMGYENLPSKFIFSSLLVRFFATNQYIEKNEKILYLKKFGINSKKINAFLFEVKFNDSSSLYYSPSFSYDYLENYEDIKKLYIISKDVRPIDCFPLIRNNVLESFVDFYKEGKSDKLLYIDPSNHSSKSFLETMIFNNIESGSVYSLHLILNYTNITNSFLDNDKKRLLISLSFIDNLQSLKEYNAISSTDSLDTICNDIQKKIIELSSNLNDNIDKDNLNLFMKKKTLELFEINDERNYAKYDFSEIIEELIAKSVIQKIRNLLFENYKKKAKKAEQMKGGGDLSRFPTENSVKINFLNIFKIIALMCTNNYGRFVISNTTLYELLIKNLALDLSKDCKIFNNDVLEVIYDFYIITKLNYNNELLNRIVRENRQKIKDTKDLNNISIKKIFLIDSLFTNSPLNDENYFFEDRFYTGLVRRINNYYSKLLEKENIKKFCGFFGKMIDDLSYESFYSLIRTLFIFIDNKNFTNDLYDKKVDFFDKKLKKEIGNISNNELNDIYFLDFLLSLYHVNDGFYQIKDEEYINLLDDNKYDINSLISDNLIPFCVKSLLLNYVLKVALQFKVKDNRFIIKTANNQTYDEKEKTHFEMTAKLIELYCSSISLLEKHRMGENAFIEKNGLYDFCCSIIKGMKALCNLIINSNDIYKSYKEIFMLLVKEYKRHQNIFNTCFNYSDTDNNDSNDDNDDNNKNDEPKEGSFEYLHIISKELDNYLKKIEENSYDISIKKSDSIFDKFCSYNNGQLVTSVDDQYSYMLNTENRAEILKKEIEKQEKQEKINQNNNQNNNNNDQSQTQNQSKSIINCQKFIENVVSEYKKNKSGILLENFSKKYNNYKLGNYVYIRYLLEFCLYNSNRSIDCLSAFTQLIMEDTEFVNYSKFENIDYFLKLYNLPEFSNLIDVRTVIIGTIMNTLYTTCQTELSISSSFCGTDFENRLTEYINMLILFLSSFAEHFNTSFYKSLLYYKFRLKKTSVFIKDSKKLLYLPTAEFKEETNNYETISYELTGKEIAIDLEEDDDDDEKEGGDNEKGDENEGEEEEILENYDFDYKFDSFVPYELLLIIYHKILFTLYIETNENYRETTQNNLLIIFHSLTGTLIEFSFAQEEQHTKLLSKFLKEFFTKKNQEVGIYHTNFQCYNCALEPIYGTRYQCKVCKNFDLCQKCYNILKDKHRHEFKRITHAKFFDEEREDKFYSPLDIITNKFDKHSTEDSHAKSNFILNELLELFLTFLKIRKQKDVFYEDDSEISSKFAWMVNFYTEQILTKLKYSPNTSSLSITEFLSQIYQDVDKFEEIHTFKVVLQYYEIVHILTKYYGYSQTESLLDDDEIKKTDFIKLSFDRIGINFFKKIVNEKFDSFTEEEDYYKELIKTSNIGEIFAFYNKYYSDIEIVLKDKDDNTVKKRGQGFINPILIHLSKESKHFFRDSINRSSRETKLLAIYDNIPWILFEMIYDYSRSNHEKLFPFVQKYLNYSLFEKFNMCIIGVYNIWLMIKYYKKPDDMEKYNIVEIDKYWGLDYLPLFIVVIIHSLLLAVVICLWYTNYFKVYYFSNLHLYSMKRDKKKGKLDLDSKAKKFRELQNKFSSSLDVIHSFFPEISRWRKSWIFIQTCLLNTKIAPFLFTFIFLILYLAVSQVFLTFPLIFIANMIPTLGAIFKGLLNKKKYLLSIFAYTMVMLYIFAWLLFLFLPNIFSYEAEEEDEEGEAICSSSVQCVLYFLDIGLINGGAFEDEPLYSFKNDTGLYVRQFFYNIFLFFIVNMVMSNVFLALITDAFGEMREIEWQNESDKADICFICQKTKDQCLIDGDNFAEHRKDLHDEWKYIFYLCNIFLKEEIELGYEEYNVYQLMKTNNLSWFPNYEDEEEEEDNKNSNNCEELNNKIDKFQKKTEKEFQKINERLPGDNSMSFRRIFRSKLDEHRLLRDCNNYEGTCDLCRAKITPGKLIFWHCEQCEKDICYRCKYYEEKDGLIPFHFEKHNHTMYYFKDDDYEQCHLCKETEKQPKGYFKCMEEQCNYEVCFLCWGKVKYERENLIQSKGGQNVPFGRKDKKKSFYFNTDIKKEEHFISKYHEHPLTRDGNTKYSGCSICGASVYFKKYFWHCDTCGFDLCYRCKYYEENDTPAPLIFDKHILHKFNYKKDKNFEKCYIAGCSEKNLQTNGYYECNLCSYTVCYNCWNKPKNKFIEEKNK